MIDDLAPSLLGTTALRPLDGSECAAAWAASGAMWLTGRPGGPPLFAPPLLGPLGVAPFLQVLAERLMRLSSLLGSSVVLDGPALLGERAAITGHQRQGEVSCGGASRLLRTLDGWIAVSLARDEDHASVPAWLEADVDGRDPLAVERCVERRPSAQLLERAALLGLACGALGETDEGAVPTVERGAAPAVQSLRDIIVVDLSSLWAGPLCGQLLAAAGARVIKVESTQRPDGARLGPRAFFDLLHAGKESIALDLTSASGRRTLGAVCARADVVIEGSRPRALAQLGVDAHLAPARVWLSVTGHGRRQPMRVGFGDDAAVAGGLVAVDGDGPVFAADAAADPIAGLLGAVAVLDRLAAGGKWLVDLSLSAAAAMAVSYGAAAVPPSSLDEPVQHPRARAPIGRAPALGAHHHVLSALLEQ